MTHPRRSRNRKGIEDEDEHEEEFNVKIELL